MIHPEETVEAIHSTPGQRKTQLYYRGLPNRLLHVDPNPGHIERKIAMVGNADSGEFAPFDDPSWEIWKVARVMPWEKRFDRWYDVHREEGNGEGWVTEWQKMVARFPDNVDIWMHYPIDGYGEQVHQYPIDPIVERFGTYFMTSSFAWMMAHAIQELRPLDGDAVPAEIGFWGIDMEGGTEYQQQRNGMRHFIELARFAGIYVTRLASSGIVWEPIPYPWRIDNPLLNKLDLRQVSVLKKIGECQKIQASSLEIINQNLTIIEILKQYKLDEERADRLKKEIAVMEDQLRTVEKDLLRLGAVEEEQGWLRGYLT